MTVTIHIPLPHKSLSPNSRGHWRVAAKHKAALRAAAKYSAIVPQPVDPWPAAEVQAHFRFQTAHKRDRDNLLSSLKAAFDGLQDARLIADDSGVVHLPVTYAKAQPGEQVGVTLTIRRIEP